MEPSGCTSGRAGFPNAIADAHDHCLEEHGSASRWIAFMDVDEEALKQRQKA
jgi:hypothetical protein